MTGFAPRLLEWFEREGRHDLPWQIDPTPYRVWVSEIMLQQTQVSTAAPYFEAFTRRFPDVGALASASLDEVLHLWSGLGYYARARHLHRAARLVVERHGGEFPDRLDAAMALPGVGRSTAGAVLALAHGERHPILDGNARRVLARCFGVEGHPGQPAVERRLWAIAEDCTPGERVAEYTQAIMDLGATVCTRSRPACLLCPVNSLCVARAHNLQDRLPTPRPRRSRPERPVWVVVALRGPGRVLLERRPPAGLWGGLWTLPEFPTRAHAEQWCREQLVGTARPRRGEVLRHAFSHYTCVMRPLELHCRGMGPGLRDDASFRWIDLDESGGARVGVPRPVEMLVRRAAGTPRSVSRAPG